MGVDYYSKAAIGVRIKNSDLYTKEVVDGCEHKPPATSKFCPECGKESRQVTAEVPIDGFDEDENFKQFCIAWGTDHEDGVICKEYAKTSSSRSNAEIDRTSVPDDLSALKQELRETLEPPRPVV